LKLHRTPILDPAVVPSPVRQESWNPRRARLSSAAGRVSRSVATPSPWWPRRQASQRTLRGFTNLNANPDTTIQIGSVVREVRARVATDEERDRLWPKFVAFYPGYDFFQSNAKGRKIPIVILDSR
jgi:hypothetical protein